MFLQDAYASKERLERMPESGERMVYSFSIAQVDGERAADSGCGKNFCHRAVQLRISMQLDTVFQGWLGGLSPTGPGGGKALPQRSPRKERNMQMNGTNRTAAAARRTGMAGGDAGG